MLPIDMLKAARQTCVAANANAKEILGYLRRNSIEVSYPELIDGGPIIYVRLPIDNQEDMIRIVNAINCPKTGSFGHRGTTILPLFLIPDYPVNMIRIAVGWGEDIQEVIGKFEKAFSLLG